MFVENRNKRHRKNESHADRDSRGWRWGFLCFFLIVLFYVCHPLIFTHEEAVFYLEAEETNESAEVTPEYNVYFSAGEARARELSVHEFKLAEACLNEDMSSCYNYGYPEGFFDFGEDDGIDKEDDEAAAEAGETISEEENDETEDDASYKLYEEALPDNIIDDEETEEDDENVHYNHKSIKDIKIALRHKPRYFGSQPVIAIVIDDMGVNVARSRDIIKLQAPLTSSFLTYGPHLSQQIDAARAAGHEIMAHVPMEPHRDLYTAPDGLTVSMDDELLKRNFEIMLKKFPGIRGVNNHMGSKFTENEQKMSDIMEVLSAHELFFLDSKTTSKSVGEKTARKYGVEYAHRHVFLDNNNNKEYILKQLAQAERIAAKNGYAVAIGHPKSQTYEALKIWLPTLQNKNLKLVHMSEIVKVLN